MKVFDYVSYKEYLNSIAGPQKRRTGLKSKMAKAIGCQNGYLSKVLNYNSHLSLEQGERLSTLLAHTKQESHYFLLLIQYERSGTVNLRKYFEEQIEGLRKEYLTLHSRVDIKSEISEQDRSRYYSSWHYCAIHIAITLKHLQTIENLSKHFNLSLSKVNEVLSFLEEISLIEKIENRFRVTTNNIYLEKGSHFIRNHHTNWRLQSLKSLDTISNIDLHYSGVITISKKDAEVIKNKLIEFLNESLNIVEKSKEEELFCLNLDFFKQ